MTAPVYKTVTEGRVVHVFPEDGEHLTDGQHCWCGPERVCVDCHMLSPCIHGKDRDEIVVHKREA